MSACYFSIVLDKVMDFLSSNLSRSSRNANSCRFTIVTLLEDIHNTDAGGGAEVAIPDQEFYTRCMPVCLPRITEFNVFLATGASDPVVIEISKLNPDVTRIPMNKNRSKG